MSEKRSIEISESERELLRSAIESFCGDLETTIDVDPELAGDLKRYEAEANDLDRKLADLRFDPVCSYELCDQSVESEGDLCSDHIAYNKAIKLGEIKFHGAIEAGETWERAIEIQRETEREALKAYHDRKGEA